jgi:hypothetical protein
VFSSFAETESAAPENGTSNARRLNPKVAGLAFILLLVGFYAFAQYLSRSGPEIAWQTDFDTALAMAQNQDRRIFLYLYEPDDEWTDNYERGLFQERYARERLAQMVPVRIELGPDDPLRRRYGFTESPTMVTLNSEGEMIAEPLVGGPIDRRQFVTYVNPTDERGY